MKITLPVQLNPISRRKDKSVKLSYETRELSPAETMTLMSMEGEEGWLLFASQEAEIDDSDIPSERVSLDTKSPQERLRAVFFVLYKQETEAQRFIGTFQSFYEQRMEKIITHIKSLLTN